MKWMLISLLFISLFASVVYAQPLSAEQVTDAITFLKNLDYENVKEEEQESISEQIDQAWKTISSTGKVGLDALKQEVKKVITGKEKKDFFKLNASALIWDMAHEDEANTIAEIWNSTPLKAQYNYVFYTAFDAARTQNPKVLPMLRACLKDKDGSIFVAQHYLTVQWPLTHEFIWGAFGPDGLPVLVNVLKDSKDPIELESAMRLLAKAYYVNALSHIRKLATSGSADVKCAAIECLGIFGHPKDYDLIIGTLRSKDLKDLFSAAYALYEFEDQRAGPHLIKLLEVNDEKVIVEVIATIAHLLTPESLDALKKFSETAKDDKYKEKANQYFQSVVEAMKLTPEEYSKKIPQEKKELCKSLNDMAESKFRMKEEDKTLSHNDFVSATEGWIKNNRITGAPYEWVESRHVLNATTPADISLLLKVKASCYLRLSDECLYETEELDEIIRRLGRGTYRTVVGLTEKTTEKVPEKKSK